MNAGALRGWTARGAALGREALAMFPAGTACLASLAVAASLWPALHRALLDLRELRGPAGVWRPLTGHLAHGSAAHLWLNLALFVPLAALRERRGGTARLLLEYALLAGTVAVGIRLLHDEWRSYCGLSGVVYGLLAAVLIEHRMGWAAGILAVKTAIELGLGGWVAGAARLEQSLGVVFLPGAHAAGLLGGAILGALERRWSMAAAVGAPPA